MEAERPPGTLFDQFADVVAVPRASLQQREISSSALPFFHSRSDDWDSIYGNAICYASSPDKVKIMFGRC